MENKTKKQARKPMIQSITLPPWPHKMPYEQFLSAVIQSATKHCERNFGFGLLPHHKRLITLCKGKDLPTLNTLYNKAKNKRNFAKDFGTAMDAEEKFLIIEWITNCILAAYDISPVPKRLKQQHIAEAKAILENSCKDSGAG